MTQIPKAPKNLFKIFLIDDQIEFSLAFQEEIEHAGHFISWEQNVDVALASMRENTQEEYAFILIRDHLFDKKNEEIRHFIEQKKNILTSFGMISNEDSAEKRFQCCTNGFDYFVNQKYTNCFIIQAIEKHLYANLYLLKIAVIEEQEQISSIIENCTSRQNTLIESFKSLREFIFQLGKAEFDLLVIHWESIAEDELEILDLIRADINASQLMIAIFSSEYQTCINNSYLNFSIDCVLSTSISSSYLQAFFNRLRTRVVYFRNSFISKEEQLVKNLHELEKIFKTSKKEQETISFLLISVLPLTNYATPIVLRVLLNKVRQQDFISYFNRSTFLLMLPGMDIETLQFYKKMIEQELSSNTSFESLKMSTKISFSCFPENGENWGEIINSLQKMHNQDGEIFSYMKREKGLTQQGPKVIILVDPDEDVLAMLKYSFASKGFSVFAFQEGKRFLQWIHEHYQEIFPDLVIMEIDLNDSNGHLVIKELNKLFGAQVPIFALSTSKQQDDLLGSHLFGINEYFQKPFNLRNLINHSLRFL